MVERLLGQTVQGERNWFEHGKGLVCTEVATLLQIPEWLQI